MSETTPHSKAEEAFIDQFTRKLVVGWADWQVRTGELPDLDKMKVLGQEAKAGNNLSQRTLDLMLEWVASLGMKEPYISYAREKGWLSQKSWKLTAKGFAVATAFLKR